MGLLQISREAKRTSPVFIIGEARSGSSMLYRTLLHHPSFAPRQETLQETSFMRQAPLAYTFDAGHPSNMRRYMLEDDDSWQAFLSSLKPIRPLLRTAALTQPILDQRVPWAWYLVPSQLVARSYLVHAQRARASRRILEKTPRHVEHVDKLLRCFPRAKLLYIHRHPVDVYSSYVRRGQTDPRAAWARIPLQEFCALYRRNAQRAARAAADRPDAVRLLSYEAFTADPERELRAVCEFLGEPYRRSLLKNFDVQEVRVAHWEGSSLLYERITTTTKEWRDYLSEQDARRVEELLLPELARFGYRRHVTAGSADLAGAGG
jgi:predicted metal-dependent hydrolase